ncbi:hypothetical protein [Aureivirga marina]|uniref:hypothetical protein n=1 Tax=Aureivirga marina TaxID=1182451 RepID=UPI0018CB1205|nr:hypothetical protein [Aureivirga marina]
MTERTLTKDEIIQNISDAINPFLKENKVYYSCPIITSYGTSGGSFFILKNDEICYDIENETEIEQAENSLDFDENLFALSQTFPENTKIQYRFEKDKLLQVKIYDVPMFLKDIERDYLQDAKTYGFTKKIEEITFSKKGKKIKTSISETIIYPEKTHEGISNYCDQNILCLYEILETKVKKLKFIFDGEKLQVEASEALEKYGFEKIKEKVDFSDFNANEITSIYAYLESFEEVKIEKALDALKDNPVLKSIAESRYIEFIKARLNNKNATIFDFLKAAPTKAEISFFTSKNRWLSSNNQTQLSFTYCDEDESKLLVDFIGAIVKKNTRLLKFSAQAKLTIREEDLEEIIREHETNFQENLRKEIENYKESWFGEICKHLLEISQIDRVLFEKTSFIEANNSIVFKEFMFFLILKSYETDIDFDIFQSDIPTFTYLFWMFRNVPETKWSNGEAFLPKKSMLKYKRTAHYKLGDGSSWQLEER